MKKSLIESSFTVFVVWYCMEVLIISNGVSIHIYLFMGLEKRILSEDEEVWDIWWRCTFEEKEKGKEEMVKSVI